jgi:hypothetical protein
MTFDFILVSELLKSCQMDGIKKKISIFFGGKNRRRLNFSPEKYS